MKNNKYEIKITTQFKKDLKNIQKRGLNIKLLDELIYMLSNDIILPSKYKNHLLEPRDFRSLGMSYKTRLVARVQKE